MSDNEKSKNNSQSSEQKSQSQVSPPQYSYGLDGYGYQFLHGQQSADSSVTEKPIGIAPPMVPAPAAVPVPKPVPVPTPAPLPPVKEEKEWVKAKPQAGSQSIEYVETESHGRRPIIFSPGFKFKSTLQNIFAKVDKDGDRRLSKEELYASLSDGRIYEDEELIVCLLVRFFDNIRRNKTSKIYFDARGITWEDAINYEGWARYIPESCMESDYRQVAKSSGVVFQKKR
jgi:hypothetical protein